jgi:hypothetical protein
MRLSTAGVYGAAASTDGALAAAGNGPPRLYGTLLGTAEEAAADTPIESARAPRPTTPMTIPALPARRPKRLANPIMRGSPICID